MAAAYCRLGESVYCCRIAEHCEVAYELERHMKTQPSYPTPRLRRLLTLEETAAALRKTPSQLRWLIHVDKAPPSALIGGRRVFDADAVASWIDAQFEQATA
jgi:hypothetical protein